MGQLLRLVFIGLVGMTLYRYLQRTFGIQIPQRPDNAPDDRNANDNRHNAYVGNRNADSAPAQIMRRCAYCKVHVPEGESTQSRGQYFCCEKHRDAYLRETR